MRRSLDAPRRSAALVKSSTTATADWRPAARTRLPRFDVAPLQLYLEKTGDPHPAIREGLTMVGRPAWQSGAIAMATVFKELGESHCLNWAPHAWAEFHEPQITRGFVHFLTAGGAQQQLARAIAFVKAATLSAGGDHAAIDRFKPNSARCAAEEERIDILVELRRDGNRIGAAVEAKFGHHLTRGQLPNAWRHAIEECKWDPERSAFLVIAPVATQVDGPVMRKHVERWTAISWWGFLNHLERLTGADYDCQDYRRFRRTVWHRAY